jgi:hypothetical protein
MAAPSSVAQHSVLRLVALRGALSRLLASRLSSKSLLAMSVLFSAVQYALGILLLINIRSIPLSWHCEFLQLWIPLPFRLTRVNVSPRVYSGVQAAVPMVHAMP